MRHFVKEYSKREETKERERKGGAEIGEKGTEREKERIYTWNISLGPDYRWS